MKSKDVGNRIKNYMRDKGVKQEQLASMMGVPQSNISAMLLGKRDIDRLVGVVEDMFDLQPGTFFKGLSVDDVSAKDGKPHFITLAHAGMLTAEQGEDYEMQPVIEQLPKYDYTVEVRGDSMLPEYKSGDVIACLNVTHSTFLQWGRVHLLNTSQGVVLKKIFDDGDSIRCVSINDEYPEFGIPRNEIFSIGLVVGSLRIV